jgi:hypothetical protein
MEVSFHKVDIDLVQLLRSSARVLELWQHRNRYEL